MSVTAGKLADEMPTIEEILSTYVTPDELPDPKIYDNILAELQMRDNVMRDDAFSHGYGKGYGNGMKNAKETVRELWRKGATHIMDWMSS